MLKRKSPPPAAPHLPLHQPGEQQERDKVGDDEHREDMLPGTSSGKPAGKKRSNGGADTAGAVDDGGDGGERLAAPSQRLVGAEFCGHGRCDQSVRAVHQEAGQHQQEGVDQVAGVDDRQALDMSQGAPGQAGLVREQGGDGRDQHRGAGGRRHPRVVGDHASNDAAHDASHVEEGAQGGRAARVQPAGGGDVVGQPEEEGVADQLGEEQAEAELDNAGYTKGAAESNCLTLMSFGVWQLCT